MARAIRFRSDYTLIPKLDGAKCKGIDKPDWFFDDIVKDRYGVEIAPEQKQFCIGCPVLVECLDYAMKVDVRGVWGGTTHYERKRKRRELGLKAEQIGLTNDRVERIHDEVA